MAKKPEFTGVLQTNEEDVSKRKPLGRVALWTVSGENEKSPVLQGTVETEKGSYRIALWKYRDNFKEGL